jgi:hypothetical protein
LAFEGSKLRTIICSEVVNSVDHVTGKRVAAYSGIPSP